MGPEGADDVDRKLLDAVDRLGRALRAARQRIATDLGLSLLQVDIVDCLSRRGLTSVGALATELHVTQPTASDAITALEHKRLVGRRRSRDDGRVTLVQLTRAGRALADKARRDLGDLYPTPGDGRTVERGIALEVVLGEIRRLQLAGVITVDRSCFSCRHYRPPDNADHAHCLLLDTPLEPPRLRVDCPEHAPAPSTR